MSIAAKPSRTTERHAPLRTQTPDPPAHLEVVAALEHVYRVIGPTGTVGYIEQVGLVFVVLDGAVYNTSVEVAQCLNLDQALQHLSAR